MISEGGGDNGLWEWWHTVLIVCASVVGLLGVIVTALCIVSNTQLHVATVLFHLMTFSCLENEQ